MRDGLRFDFLPGLAVAVVTLVAALPWGLPSEARFLLPLLPFTVIHHFAARRPGSMPEWLVFLSGFATDVLTHGPLGFWSFIFLVGYVLARLARLHDLWGPIGQWLELTLLLLLLAALQWLIASAYFLGAVDWRPLVRGTALAALMYPVVITLIGLFERAPTVDISQRFERRG